MHSLDLEISQQSNDIKFTDPEPTYNPPSGKKTVAGSIQFEATNGVTAATSGITAAAVMSISMSKKLRLPIQNATSWLHSATSWLHLELEEATFLLRLLKKALMALPVLYLSTWVPPLHHYRDVLSLVAEVV